MQDDLVLQLAFYTYPASSMFMCVLSIVLCICFLSTCHGVSENEMQVVIIGAGLAGSKVAYELHNRNISFIIVEATEQVGGRLRRQRISPGGPLVELGANWVQGFVPGERFSDFVSKEVQLKGVVDDADDAYFVKNGKIVPDEIADVAWNRVTKAMAKVYALSRSAVSTSGKRLFDMTIKSALLLVGGWEANTPIDKAALGFDIEFEYAVPASQVPISSLSEFYDPENVPSQDIFVTDPRGFRILATWHLKRAGIKNSGKSSNRLRLNSPVREIRYGSNGAHVILRDGSKIRARAVVSTVSLGVLKSSLSRGPPASNRLIFKPPLPFDKRMAISKFLIADYLKFFIQFKKPLFKKSDPLYLFPLECSEGGFVNLQNLNKDGYFPGSNIVLLTAIGAFNRDLLCMSSESRLNEALKYVSIAIGRQVFPWEVKGQVVPTFATRQFFKGSYSNRGVSMTEDDIDALNRQLKSLFFAGEAHSELVGYVQGAWESGERVAKEVSAYLSKST